MAQSRYYSATAQPTVLTAAITPSTLVITVQQTVGFPVSVPYILALDYNSPSEEVVLVTAQAGTSLTITRAYDGTSAASHNAGAAVRHTWTALDGTDSRVHEGSTANVHGVTGNLVGETSTQTLTNKTLTSPVITGTVTGGASYTSPSITGTVGGGATYSAPNLRDAIVLNSATGVRPVSVDAISGTTVDLARVRLNAVDQFKILSTGGMNSTPTSSATDILFADAASGMSGDMLDLGVNGVKKFQVNNSGDIVTARNGTFTGTMAVGSTSQFTVSASGDIATTGIGAIVSKFKTADTSRASTTTLTADGDLTAMSVVATGAYVFEGMIFYSAIDSADLKVMFTGPAGATLTWHGGTQLTTGTGTTGTYIYDTQLLGSTYAPGGGDAAGNSTIMMLDLKGLFRTTGTSGTFSMSWAQNTSNATATIVRAGSFITLTRIA